MSDIAVIIASVETSLIEMAKQVGALGAGLQTAAPGAAGTPNKSVDYLLAESALLRQQATQCKQLISFEQPIKNTNAQP